MKKRFATMAILVTAVAAPAGLFASPANSHGNSRGSCLAGGFPDSCRVSLTAAGPSPSTLTMHAGQAVSFFNTDSVAHTIVFANGLCSLTLTPGQGGYGGGFCSNDFTAQVGSYPYTEDGKFPGSVRTMPWHRSVTLTARTHTIQGGTRLTLHGLVLQSNTGAAPPPPVLVLARPNSSQPFEPVTTVRTRGAHQTSYQWKLKVKPNATTTYIAKVTAQRLCYFPASRCADIRGQFWTNAQSRPFTVRIRH
jgi:plastocyanin